MSQQPNPSPGFAPREFSRIPSTLASNRSGANSRLPSPPVSPGLGSPCTPTPAGGNAAYGHAPWVGGMFAQGQDRMGSSGSGRSIAGAPQGMAATMTTPSSVGLRAGFPPTSVPRSDSLRASTTILARTPISSSGIGGYPGPNGHYEPGGVSAPSPLAAAGGGASGATSDHAAGNGASSSSRSSIQVAVRVRPLCDKERQRGDRVAWEADREGNVGTLDVAGTFVPKHRFDTVFGPDTDNGAVAAQVALPLVSPALRGVNGTIFAYGVTSSGKTHTMMGTDVDPGVVPRVIRELFAQIAAAGTSRCFSVRMSVMEIYNEVLNDLLDPARVNLKVREDSRSGLVLVEGLLEQQVTNAEQALELIARGDHNRKVSATAFNEDSSRSHTITRIIVESTALALAPGSSGPEPPPSPSGDRPVGRRTTACLSLIDLAGSESARAVMSKGQRMEGSYINRSLLTLGTVIHKLAAGAAGHVPFRDSKLTRLLQPSLSGPGARVAVVCNITPAAAQTDETANTLKFASRAKLIQVTARTNEILDERSMLRRYQKEVADLKRQLADARKLLADGAGGATGAAAASAGGVGGLAAAASVVGDFGALGSSGEEAAAAELQSERDARRAVEIECTMMRIKLARLQAFLEENGFNVDDVLLAGAGASGENQLGDIVAASPSRRPSPPGSEDVSSFLVKGRAAALVGSTGGGGVGLRHAASSPRLEGDPFGGVQSTDGGASAAGGVKPRASLSGRRVSEAELGGAAGAGGAAGGRLGGWSSEPPLGQATGGRRGQASGASSPSGSERAGGDAAVPQTTSADLRAQVAAVLGAAAGTSGGGSCPRPRGSASGTFSGSELEMDEDLNEGIMAQIRDMITEARLTSPGPQSATSQPRRSQGDDAASTGDLPATGGRAPAAGGPASTGRRTPGGGGVAAAATAAGSGPSVVQRAPSAGGPASVSSHHRRSATLSTASSSYGAGADLDMDLELQVLNADREVLHDQLVASEAANERLTAQLADLRRQLSTYEQLTRHAASELAEIRRLKEAFQARLQRENDALRAQLAGLGVSPVLPHSGPGDQPSQQPPRAPVRPGGGAASEPGLGLAHPPPQSPMQLQPGPHMQHAHRYGVQSMAAFGSPAAVAPLSIPRVTAPSALAGRADGEAAWASLDGETPTRSGPGFAGVAAAATAQQQPSRLKDVNETAAAATGGVRGSVEGAAGLLNGGRGMQSIPSFGTSLRPAAK